MKQLENIKYTKLRNVRTTLMMDSKNKQHNTN